MSWSEQVLFVATKNNPNHSYIFESTFNEVICENGFTVMGITKIETNLTSDGNLIILAFIDDKLVAKSFIFFDWRGSNSKAILVRKICNDNFTHYYKLNLVLEQS